MNTLTSEYKIFEGYSIDYLKSIKWDIVCFVLSVCNGHCSHCWSSETYLGNQMPLSWHFDFWNNINKERVNTITLTGGEPLLFKELGGLIDLLQKKFGNTVPIKIYTSGRGLVSIYETKNGIIETSKNIIQRGFVLPNIEIHLSADEHHLDSLINFYKIGKTNEKDKAILLKTYVSNFLKACDLIRLKEQPDFLGRIKLHVEYGRLQYHRDVYFSWMSNSDWNTKVIKSEGIIHSGAAKELKNTISIQESDQISLFILPGAEFYSNHVSLIGQPYITKNHLPLFLGKGRTNGLGASIIGWWNLINKQFCGGTAYDTYKFLK